MNQPPVSQDIAAAFGKFFFGGIGPTHTDLTGVFLGAGLSDVAPAPRGSQSKQGPNKQERVQRTVLAAIRKPQYARTLVDGLLSALRTHGAVVEGTPQFDKANTEVLRRALARQGWNLAPDGHMTPIGAINLETGGREALDDQIRRLRQNTDDPALLLGTAKELLESVAKFVLQELRVQGSGQNLNFNKLWHLARKRLGILPEQVAGDGKGSKAIKAILDSAWKIVEQVNVLRNLQGTGHGRTLPPGVTAEQALLVVRETCSIAEFTLATLDRQRPK
jgi:hypothetical protein